MTSWASCNGVYRHPDKVSGCWVFSGTRVPAATLFENLKDGASIDQFLSLAWPRQQWRGPAIPLYKLTRRGDACVAPELDPGGWTGIVTC